MMEYAAMLGFKDKAYIRDMKYKASPPRSNYFEKSASLLGR